MLIIQDKQGEFIEETYKQVLSKDYRALKKYHQLRAENKIDILCNCQEDPVEMTLSYFKSTGNYHIRSMPNQSHLHDKKCSFHQDYEGSGEHEPGWREKEDENGNIKYSINLDKLAFGGTKKEYKNRKESDKKEGQGSVFYRRKTNKRSKSKSDVTLLGLATRLNMMAFEDYQNSQRHYEEMPQTRWELINQAWATSRKIDINYRRNLNDYWYSYDKRNEVKQKDELFVFHPATQLDVNHYRKHSFIFLEFYPGAKPQIVEVDNELLKDALKRNIFTKDIDLDFDNISSRFLDDYIISGFIEVRRAKNGRTTHHFLSLEFLPVTKFGLWVESSHERRVFTLFHYHNILFTKPYESMEFYENYVPDILFKRLLSPNKVYIGEIFGIVGVDKYDERKKKKIQLAKESSKFELWYWDITKHGVGRYPQVY